LGVLLVSPSIPASYDLHVLFFVWKPFRKKPLNMKPLYLVAISILCSDP
jgi:hypothetical protein